MKIIVRAIEFIVPARVEHQNIAAVYRHTGGLKIFCRHLFAAFFLNTDNRPGPHEGIERQLFDGLAVRHDVNGRVNVGAGVTWQRQFGDV